MSFMTVHWIWTGVLKSFCEIFSTHMAINYITGRVCGSCNSHGSSMIPIQKPIREQYCYITIQNYIALISLAITSIRSYSGVAVMSPVLQARGPGFESRLIR